MKKSEIKELVKSASDNKKIINAFFRYDPYYYKNIIPLMTNDKLFLVINEDDFILAGGKLCLFGKEICLCAGSAFSSQQSE